MKLGLVFVACAAALACAGSSGVIRIDDHASDICITLAADAGGGIRTVCGPPDRVPDIAERVVADANKMVRK